MVECALTTVENHECNHEHLVHWVWLVAGYEEQRYKIPEHNISDTIEYIPPLV